MDAEFISLPGERPDPVCLVAWELRSNRKIRLWRDQFGSRPPYPLDPHSLFVAYFASAELGCHLALSWRNPACILDLFVEFRNCTNGQPPIAGNSLQGALAYHGLDSIGAAEKGRMRDLILGGGPWSREEQTAILDYCESDVQALARLLPAMLPAIDLPRAIYRGRYMGAVAAMEFTGVPINLPLLNRLRGRWTAIQDQLIAKIDADYGVFEGRTFKTAKFERWLVQHQISWPRLDSGQLDLDNETFKEMAGIYPALTKLRELRHSLSEMRLNDLAVGRDAANRCLLSPFSSRTSRNQPSTTKFIFGPSKWLRGLIKPQPGWALGYVDWVQQEFGIAAALSNDSVMLAAYLSGDPYLAFAKQAGVMPTDATKETHAVQRELFKQCVLGTQYGMAEGSLALRIGRPTFTARRLLHLHREVYHQFWKWSDNTVDRAVIHNSQATVFGWTNHISSNPNPRSIRNFHMQANGAEMLRLACCFGTENGIAICAPIHDAVLIAAPIGRLESDIVSMRHYMAEASKIVLAGFELRTDVKTVVYPEHYSPGRGQEMWDTVMGLL